jgi:hypothetical protein
MLELRPAIVVESPRGAAQADEREQRLVVQLTGAGTGGELLEALADTVLVGPAERGDRVIVHIGAGVAEAAAVHVNLTRGLSHEAAGAGPVKLAGTTLQHRVDPVEEDEIEVPLPGAVAVLHSHAQLAPLAWAFARAAPGAALGYVQLPGCVLTGARSPEVRALRAQRLLAGHLTAGEAFAGAEGEALTAAGAIHHGLRRLGWSAVACGPGPEGPDAGAEGRHGTPGSAINALEAAHTALALGCSTLLVAGMSPAARAGAGRGISRGTLAVLDLLLEPVTVALPAGMRSPVGSDLRASLNPVFAGGEETGGGGAPELARPARIARHDWRRAEVDLPAFAAAGLADPAALTAAPLRFAAGLAGGSALAGMLADNEERVELESA